MKLDIGCGKKKRGPGWTSVDIRPETGADIIAWAWELKDIKDNSVEAIYSRHMIEHLTLAQAVLAFKEWNRVLKMGGTAEIICPNRLFHIEQLKDPLGRSPFGPWSNYEHALAGLHGWQNNPFDIHKWSWTTTDLSVELVFAGFKTQGIPTRECDVHIMATKCKSPR